MKSVDRLHRSVEISPDGKLRLSVTGSPKLTVIVCRSGTMVARQVKQTNKHWCEKASGGIQTHNLCNSRAVSYI